MVFLTLMASTSASSAVNRPSKSSLELAARVASINYDFRACTVVPIWQKLAVIQLAHTKASKITSPFDAKERSS